MSKLDNDKLRLAELQAELDGAVRCLDNIPHGVKQIPHWVLTSASEDKRPINPHTGRWASSKKEDQWGTFEEAVRAFKTNDDAIGIAFCFTELDPYVVLDLDHCIVDRELHDEAKKIVKLLDSYTELSISGKGLHIIIRAEKTEKRCIYKNCFAWSDHPPGHVEIYDGCQSRKFITLTGRCLCALGVGR